MNLELNGYKITLGPRALAHVETMRLNSLRPVRKIVEASSGACNAGKPLTTRA